MNCIDARRALLTEPGTRSAALAAHLAACAPCAAEAARSARFEHLLREAARVPVAEELASKVLLRQEFERDAGGRSSWLRPRLAIAAGVLLATGLALGIGIDLARSPDLDDEVVALIGEAAYALQSTETVAPEQVAAALQPVGLALNGEIGEVTFASRCIVRGRLSGHLVLRGDTAPVTVFLIPHPLIDEREDLHSATLAGVLVPAASGTIAIIGAPGERLAAIESRVRAAVRWPA